MTKWEKFAVLAVSALLLMGCAQGAEDSEPVSIQTITPVEGQIGETTPVETAGDVSDMAEATWIPLDATGAMQMDLDGDGAQETITVLVDEDAYTTTVTVADEGVVYTETEDMALMFLSAYDGDALMGDGCRELYLTGDPASNDNETHVYRIENGKLLHTEVYGEALSADGAALHIRTSVDVFGTFEALCDYALTDGFSFAMTPHVYTVVHTEEDWQYRGATLKKEGFPVTDASGTAIRLPAGTRLLLTETDAASYAVLEDEQGARYRVEIQKVSGDWQWYVDGIAESEWFEMLAYAG